MSERMINMTVECFVEKDGKYLMLKRNPNSRILPSIWIAPGGHQEFCEGIVEATRREIKEETGLEIKNIRVRVVGISYLRDIDQEFCFRILTADYAGGELKGNPHDGDFVWLEPNEMLRIDNILEELKPIIPLILLNNDTNIYFIRSVYNELNNLVEFEIENQD
jgi:8-oxo-dGTP diphosphatase